MSLRTDRRRPETLRLVELLVLLAVLFGGVARPALAETRLVVVSGIGGEERFRESFSEWSSRVVEAANSQGLEAEQITRLSESADDPSVDQRSTKENVLAVLARLSDELGPQDDLWWIYFGHGSATGGDPKLNLPGPDLTATELAAALDAVSAGRTVVVAAASASGGFVPILSKENRIVVTATKSGSQGNESLFGDFFSQAFSSDDSDRDKDGRVSVLEAFEFARLAVNRHYESGGLLQTEHALLDDDGDGQGATEPVEVASGQMGDGLIAQGVHFGGGPGGAAVPSGLSGRRAEIERQLTELRAQKNGLEESVYLQELERLLVELAKIDREIEGESP